ncbi:beta-1,4-galactosyltransferase 4-like isoform X2 [Littorina saxatilis]|uniref:Beta-1,4-galactosyltransferase n=1 Tax=Littorina saxatilis TaxID=31220 RepID=A0AAN9AMV5_9CAEN
MLPFSVCIFPPLFWPIFTAFSSSFRLFYPSYHVPFIISLHRMLASRLTSNAYLQLQNIIDAHTTLTGHFNVNTVTPNCTGVLAEPYLPWCPQRPHIKEYLVPLNLMEITYPQLVAQYGTVMKSGGHYSPPTCQSTENLAIIIPYRNRTRNLHILLNNLLPFLWRQQVQFTVFLAEQTKDYDFNKGLVFNAAYRESQKLGKFTCYIMQDTDVIPMDYRNLYKCDDTKPRHLCQAVGQKEWPKRLKYAGSFGGAIAFRPKHFEIANGFSVSYYGWGLEDDDLWLRFRKFAFRIARYPFLIGKYHRLDHPKQTHNPRWTKLKRTIYQRRGKEGLNTLNYTLVASERKELYTRFLIQPPPPPPSIYGQLTTVASPTAKITQAGSPAAGN